MYKRVHDYYSGISLNQNMNLILFLHVNRGLTEGGDTDRMGLLYCMCR